MQLDKRLEYKDNHKASCYILNLKRLPENDGQSLWTESKSAKKETVGRVKQQSIKQKRLKLLQKLNFSGIIIDVNAICFFVYLLHARLDFLAEIDKEEEWPLHEIATLE